MAYRRRKRFSSRRRRGFSSRRGRRLKKNNPGRIGWRM